MLLFCSVRTLIRGLQRYTELARPVSDGALRSLHMHPDNASRRVAGCFFSKLLIVGWCPPFPAVRWLLCHGIFPSPD